MLHGPSWQARFRQLLSDGDLVDSYRALHPVANWERDVTWRGTPGKDGPPESGRYYNKVRAALVARSLASHVDRLPCVASARHAPRFARLCLLRDEGSAPQPLLNHTAYVTYVTYVTLHPLLNHIPHVTYVTHVPPQGMRIDYVLVSRPLAPRIARAVVLGHGAERHGFIGSDHCPLLVEFVDSAPEIVTSVENAISAEKAAVATDAGAAHGGEAGADEATVLGSASASGAGAD